MKKFTISNKSLVKTFRKKDTTDKLTILISATLFCMFISHIADYLLYDLNIYFNVESKLWLRFLISDFDFIADITLMILLSLVGYYFKKAFMYQLNKN